MDERLGMARINLVTIDDSDDPNVQAIHELMSAHGRDWESDHWRLEANCPEVMEHLLRARTSLWEASGLPLRTLEKIAVAVSVANGCLYCTGAFCTHLVDLGSDTDAVGEFVQSVGEGEIDDRDAAILAFALQSLDDPKGVTDDQIARLRENHGLSDRTLLEIVYVVNLVSGFNRIVDTFDAAYDHPFPEAVLRTRLDGT